MHEGRDALGATLRQKDKYYMKKAKVILFEALLSNTFFSTKRNGRLLFQVETKCIDAQTPSLFYRRS